MRLGFHVLLVVLLAASTGPRAVVPDATPGQSAGGQVTGDEPPVAHEAKRVLALYWYPSNHPVTSTFNGRFQAVLKRRTGNRVEQYTEYFESERFPGESQAQIMRDYLARKYADRTIDVILAWGSFTLEFLLMHRQDLFPNTPIVAYVSTLDSVMHLDRSGVTGVLNTDAYEKTLELALNLHPQTRHVVIISGTPGRDRRVEYEAAAQLARFQDRVKLTYLTDMTLDQLIAGVKALPADSLILYARFTQDQPGPLLQPSDVLNILSRAAAVPIYAPWKSLLGHGSVGGFVDDPISGATTAAEIVLRVAGGTDPADIPFAAVPKVATFDARQLERWGISNARLPAASVVLFHEPTAWDQYKGYVIGSAVVLFVQAMLILGLLAQRRQRRLAQALLERSEQRYELATAAGLVGVWEWNFETGEFYLDPALPAALGLDSREIRDWHEWVSHALPGDAARMTAGVQAHIEGRTPFYEAEHRMRHRNGSTLWFLARGSRVPPPDGHVAKMIGTFTDITRSKVTEASLANAQEELARMSRLTALGEFAASIAHEVSQPLSAILMNARAGVRWMAHPDPPLQEIRMALLEIAEAGNRAKELMRRNRELFQSHTVEKLTLDINGVVHEVVAIARTRLQHAYVVIEILLDEELPPVLGDRLELQQVLLNLIINAVDAMETVPPTARRIRIASSVNEYGMVEIRVQDTGIGLGEVDPERIFMPSYTTKPHGTGVGLSICRSIIDAHGGRLWAESGSGPGATFCFTIPMALGANGADERTTAEARLH